MNCIIDKGRDIVVVIDGKPRIATIANIYQENNIYIDEECYNLDVQFEDQTIKTYAIESFGTKLFINFKHYEWNIKYRRFFDFTDNFILSWDYAEINKEINHIINTVPNLSELEQKILFLKQRNINKMYHFTNILNLKSILENGLIPRTLLDDKKIKYEYNDTSRLDGMKNFNCFTLTFPNVRYLNSKDIDMCILEFDEELIHRLIRRDLIYFSDYNAARSDKSFGNAFINFKKMFRNKNIFLQNPNKASTEYLASPHDRDVELPPSFPSHDQAEILVKCTIRSTNIKRIIFKNEDIVNKVLPLLKKYNISYIVDERYFYDRIGFIRSVYDGETNVFCDF